MFCMEQWTSDSVLFLYPEEATERIHSEGAKTFQNTVLEGKQLDYKIIKYSTFRLIYFFIATRSTFVHTRALNNSGSVCYMELMV